MAHLEASQGMLPVSRRCNDGNAQLTLWAQESTVGELEALVGITIALVADVTRSNSMTGVKLDISVTLNCFEDIPTFMP